MPQKHDRIIRTLLFELATWHALAKLRLHTESTLNALENSATRLGSLLRKFKNDVCSAYATRNLPSEEAARGRRQAAKAQKAGGGAQPPTKTSAKASKLRGFNMETYKLHAFPDYPASIRAYGVTENTSTKNVRVICVAVKCWIYLTLILLQGEGEHKRVKQFYPRVRKGDHIRGIARHIYRERTLFQTQQAFKIKEMDNNQSKEDAITLNIPFTEVEVLGPTPPEQHHHMSKDVRHKVDVFKWLAENRKDPALKVSDSFFIKYLWKELINDDRIFFPNLKTIS